MRDNHYQALIRQLGNRAAQASLSILGIRNPALRAYLEKFFSAPPGQYASYLGDPVFEATFGWRLADRSMDELASDLLSEELVAAMDNPPKELKENRFNRSWRPYVHQLAAWRQLLADDPRSVIVTSGTGSGKTECFLVPVLDDLARQAEREKRQLVGVQALFLYPLNALIASQRDRLRAWTHGLDGKVRFCLYNGNTPQTVKASMAREHPCEILDRKTLRVAPPPLLVTNTTMLEYMLVRSEDAPIVEKSRGKLKWIILDEAHSYIGSQAAELSLLLRRVMHGFGVSPENLRFVATSATIGGTDAEQKLAEFLADLAGIDKSQVSVIGGERHVPPLPGRANGGKVHGGGEKLEELAAISAPEERFEKLTDHPLARDLRDYLSKRPAASLAQLEKKLKTDPLPWLDLCSAAQKKGETFLPLRAHLFHRVTPGLWACPDRKCGEKKKSVLDDPKWPYGMVYLEPREKCRCGAPLFDLVACSSCGEQMLLAEEDSEFRIVPRIWRQEDEFSLLDEGDEEDDESISAGNEDHGTTVLIFNRDIKNLNVNYPLETIAIDLQTGETGEGVEKPVDLRAVRLDHGVEFCPCCEKEQGSRRELFRRMMLGAPFHLGTLIPTALEYCPEGSTPLDSPHFGKRLITFTDSRQGTARIAIRQQQDAERNAVRSIVYHALRDKGGASAEELAELDEDIAELKPLASRNKRFAKMLKEKQQEREAMTGYRPISWDEMCAKLAEAEDVKKWMHRYYQDLDRDTFGRENVRELAGMLLAREFARRPMRVNSLETMGLVAVHYPGLDATSNAPAIWLERGASKADWRDFLKIALDFYVRGNTFINLPDNWVRWMGAHFFAKTLLAPNVQDRATSRSKLWPQFKRGGLRARLIRLLFHILHLDPEKRADQDICDDFLQKAWTELLNRRVLQQSDYQYYLPLEQISFRLMQRGWVCPVTGRFLDVTLKGVTPYLLQKPAPQNSQCGAPLDIPVLETGAVDDRQQALAAAQEWLAGDERVRKLRQRGLWIDVSDRIIEKVRVFRVAEHSAQQPGWRLQKYEDLFKREQINILSCSTTMEMGVDIGGISTVAMNNVPPHPANYLQRAGRAGRRGEARALAITLCKDNAHEQMVFGNTRWAFKTPPPVPRVSLNSAPIVQRHVNSMLLSYFFNRHDEIEGMRLKSGSFFLPGEDRGSSLADYFLDMCLRLEGNDMPEELVAGLAMLLRGTILEGKQTDLLVSKTRQHLAALKDKWRQEHDVLAEQLEKLTKSGDEKNPAARAVSKQLFRMEGEYLLSELATKAFLPGYGFPVHIASFNNITREQIERENREGQDSDRDDNRLRARDLPSRDAATAIREYAPGADIVIDGKVYKSCGLSLTWQAPMSEKEVREVQDIRVAWRCRNCGETGISRTRGVEDFSCPHCQGTQLDFKTFIQPSGYTVDFYQEPHNDVSTQTYVPVKKPWIAIDKPWQSLSDHALGRSRSSREGRIFVYSSGLDDCGYTLCLGCGRAESQSAPDMLPDIFTRPHQSPRFQKKGEECPGNANDWLIMRNLHLGFDYQTDVFELQLNHADGSPLHDETIATTLAVALRRALAAMLGIDAREIDYLVTERRENGRTAHSIIIHDVNSGGSGYASQLSGLLEEALKRTRDILDCPGKCEKSCHRCLLSHDTRFDINHLDRQAALDFINQTDLLTRLQLPDELCFFKGGSSFESQPLFPEAVQRAMRQISASRISFFIAGLGAECAQAELQQMSFIKHVHRWAADGMKVELVFEGAFFHALEQEQKLGLIALQDVPNISLLKTTGKASAALRNDGLLLCEVGGENDEQSEVIGWASKDSLALSPGEQWGSAENSPIVRSAPASGTFLPGSTPIGRDEIFIPRNGDKLIEITSQLDDEISSFGKKFWERIDAELDPALRIAGNAVTKMVYSDRYLCSPLHAALLFQLAGRLRELAGVKRVEIRTARMNERHHRQPYALYHNWRHNKDMEYVLRLLVMKTGAQPAIRIKDKKDLPHARRLVLEYENGQKLTIFLDQGLGFWKARGKGDGFPFEGDEKRQARHIENLKCHISGNQHSTYLVIRPDQ